MATPDLAHDIIRNIDELRRSNNYRQAYKQWQELYRLISDGLVTDVDHNGLRYDIEQDSRERSDEIIQQLDRLTSRDVPTEGFDASTARHLLDQLFDALLPDDRAYETYQGIVNNRTTQQKQQRDYNLAYRQVSHYWEQADEQLMRLGDSTGRRALLPLYEQALAEAEKAAAANPDNPYIQQLRDQAREEREKFADEENIMTSGGQTGDFERVFQHINNLRPDQFVMVYDLYGIPIEPMSKEDAREEVTKQARIYVRDKTDEYVDAARNQLDVKNPRGALTELEKVNKFLRLEGYVDNLLEGQVLRIYDDTRSNVEAELRQLEQAEKQARAAQKRAEQDALGAWQDYQTALALYPSAKNETVFEEAHTHIIDTMTRTLRERLSDIEGMRTQKRYQEALTAIQSLITAYDTIAPIQNSQVIVDARQLEAQLREIISNRRTIQQELREINNLADSNTSAAKQRMQTLEGQYPDLIREDPLYDEVKPRVVDAADSDAELQRLRGYLDSKDANRVQAAINAAQAQAARPQNPFRVEFEDLSIQLTLYQRFLQAEHTLRIQGHDAAIEAMQTISQEASLDSDLFERINKRLQQLRQEQRTLAANQERLKKADDELNRGDFAAANLQNAWEQLLRVESFIDADQKAHWLSLVRDSFDRLDIQTNFNSRIFQRLMRRLQTADAVVYEQTRPQVEIFEKAQIARDDRLAGHYTTALERWQNLVTEVGGREREYIYQQMSDINRAIYRQEKDEFINRAIATKDQREQLNEALGDLDRLSGALKKVLHESDEVYEQLEYAVWSVEVDLVYAQYSANIQKQAAMLQQVSVFAEREIAPRLSQLEQRKMRDDRNSDHLRQLARHARRMNRVSQLGPKIGQAMLEVELHVQLKGDFNAFGNAIVQWQAAFADVDAADAETTDEMNKWFGAYRRWFETRTREVAEELRQAIDDSGDTATTLSAKSMRYYVSLLLLNPNDVLGQRMLRQLAMLQGSLHREFNALLSQLPFGQHVDPDSHDPLASQMQYLSSQIEYMEIVADTAERFPHSLPQATQTVSNQSLAVLCRIYKGKYEELRGALSHIRREITTFMSRLEGFNLTLENYQSFTNDLNSSYEAIIRDIDDRMRQIVADLEKDRDILVENAAALRQFSKYHPAVMALNGKKDETISRYTALVNLLSNIRQACEEQRFADAAHLLDDKLLADDKLGYANSDLYEDITIRDTYSNRTVNGWPMIENWIRQQATTQRRILDWSAAFFDPTPAADRVPPANVVNWSTLMNTDVDPFAFDVNSRNAYYDYILGAYQRQRYNESVKHQAQALVDYGRFMDATHLVDSVLGDTMLDSLYTLKQANELFSHPPLADVADATTTDYDEAIRRAGSQVAAERLRWMQQYRQIPINAEYRDAQAFLQTIAQIRQQWDDLVREYRQHLTVLSKETRKYPDRRTNPLRGGAKRRMEKAFSPIQAVLREMKDTCVRHPDYISYNHHVLVDRARVLLDLS